MNPKDDDRAPEFDLLSRQAQQRLRARVANSDIETVRREIRAQLDEFDSRPEATDSSTRLEQQSEHAFLLAQLTYLNMLEQAEGAQEQPERRSFKDSIRAVFGRTPAVR